MHLSSCKLHLTENQKNMFEQKNKNHMLLADFMISNVKTEIFFCLILSNEYVCFEKTYLSKNKDIFSVII